jgi:hypothetical protein
LTVLTNHTENIELEKLYQLLITKVQINLVPKSLKTNALLATEYMHLTYALPNKFKLSQVMTKILNTANNKGT